MDKDNIYDDLLGNPVTQKEDIKVIQFDNLGVNLLHPFKNHPFKIKEDANFNSVKESVRKFGIIEAIVVRPRKQGTGYEIVSGHRRWTIAKQLGLKKIPARIVDVPDDLAIIMMVDGNKKRDKLDYSEYAYAFKMRLEAEQRYSRDNGGGRITDRIGKDFGMSARNVSNYIKLTDLLPELMEALDGKKLKMTSALEVADMSNENQQVVLEYYNNYGEFPKRDILKEAKDLDILGIEDLCAKTTFEKKDIDTSIKQFDVFFPKEWGESEKIDVICNLLEGWQKEHGVGMIK